MSSCSCHKAYQAFFDLLSRTCDFFAFSDLRRLARFCGHSVSRKSGTFRIAHSRPFVFTAHRTTGNDDVFFAVFRFIEKTGDKVSFGRYIFTADGAYPLDARLSFRPAVRTAENNAALIAYRHRTKNARIQIFFIQRKRAQRTICERIRFLPRTFFVVRLCAQKCNAPAQHRNDNNGGNTDQNIIKHTDTIPFFRHTHTQRTVMPYAYLPFALFLFIMSA